MRKRIPKPLLLKFLCVGFLNARRVNTVVTVVILMTVFTR